MDDFPAAHSMDTTWFAVDKDGNVAVFETGESGAVPIDAIVDESEPSDAEEEVKSLPATGAHHDPLGYAALAEPDREHISLASYAGISPASLLMFVRDPAPIRELLDRLGARELPATQGACFTLEVSDPHAFAELHEREACVHCQLWFRSDDTLAQHGLFLYEHTCENWIAGPYARLATPRAPISLDALPEAIRAKAIRYDGRFSDTAMLQPLEHWECESWEAAWLATDRKTVRAVPGREAQYAEHVANTREYQPDLVFVDAPPPTASTTKADATPPKPTTPEPTPQIPWWQFWRKK